MTRVRIAGDPHVTERGQRLHRMEGTHLWHFTIKPGVCVMDDSDVLEDDFDIVEVLPRVKLDLGWAAWSDHTLVPYDEWCQSLPPPPEGTRTTKRSCPTDADLIRDLPKLRRYPWMRRYHVRGLADGIAPRPAPPRDAVDVDLDDMDKLYAEAGELQDTIAREPVRVPLDDFWFHTRQEKANAKKGALCDTMRAEAKHAVANDFLILYRLQQSFDCSLINKFNYADAVLLCQLWIHNMKYFCSLYRIRSRRGTNIWC
jgi:hypothetical protein